MDRIDKFLDSLPLKLHLRVLVKMRAIEANQLDGLDVKKLRGGYGYRVRIGRIRVVFRYLDQAKQVPEIIFIGYRDSTTYRHLPQT